MKKAGKYLLSTIVILVLMFGSLAMVPAQAQAAGSQKYFVVQFAGPIEDSWKEAVTAEGGEILDYIPDFSFKVRMNPGIANRVAQLGFVSAVVPFQSEFKFGADLKRDGEANLYRIRVERGSDFGQVRALVAQTGAEILSYDGDLMILAANGSLVDALVEIDDVASINNFYLNELHSASDAPAYNESGGNLIGADAAHARGYNGSTQTVAVADTGLGTGVAATAHRDIPSSRIVAIYNWAGVSDSCWTITDDGAVDVDSGHGTHTTGSVLSGGAPNGVGRGVAPAAQLVFQAVENWATMKGICALYYDDGYYLPGLPSDLNTLFQQAYAAGARIHSNSWGSAAAGDYTTESVQADTFIWNNRDMVITFSAGNEGIDANSDGVIDNDSMGSPATAKNVLTVGASENQRTDSYPCDTSLTYTTCASQGGANSIFTYGGAWPADYPANPIFSDSSAGNAGQMAAFSSRGPTDDTRIKPDVVAPGTWILSTYSDLYQQGYDASVNPQNGAYQYDGYGFPYDAYYKYLSGTSMSNPLTAGGAAVVRDYYNKAYGSTNPSAALIKATIINSAVDMLDENNDGANDNDFPIPNNHEGWGLVNLDAATDGSIAYVDEGTGLSTNGTHTFNVTTTGGPLKVTLVWSDYPSTDAATVNLVNDLDLTVSGPSGTFRGNVFSGGWSATGGSADRRNNVENVYIQTPTAGTYTVTINGYNVPNGPQKYALVVDGGTISTPPAPVSTGFLAPTAQAAVTASAGDNNGFQTNPANAFGNDSVFAVDTDSGSNKNTTCTSTGKDKHQYYNYNFSIPSGTVLGIEVRLDARA
ncbi:MAG: S8 family serine peptidase, partial [Chloroflexi bacterium]|nr:S8 family serine peptidase [Chloroflexota bacterium]